MVGSAKKSPQVIGKALKDINKYAKEYEDNQEKSDFIPKGWKIKGS